MEETKKKGLNTSSNSYTIIYSVVIVVIVAFLLAFVSSTLKPQQDENVALDKKKQILAALNIRDIDGAEATEQYNKVITADMIINRDGTTIAKGEQGGTKTGFLCNSASTKEGKLALYVCNVDGQTKFMVPTLTMRARPQVLVPKLKIRAPGRRSLRASTSLQPVRKVWLSRL